MLPVHSRVPAATNAAFPLSRTVSTSRLFDKPLHNSSHAALPGERTCTGLAYRCSRPDRQKHPELASRFAVRLLESQRLRIAPSPPDVFRPAAIEQNPAPPRGRSHPLAPPSRRRNPFSKRNTRPRVQPHEALRPACDHCPARRAFVVSKWVSKKPHHWVDGSSRSISSNRVRLDSRSRSSFDRFMRCNDEKLLNVNAEPE